MISNLVLSIINVFSLVFRTVKTLNDYSVRLNQHFLKVKNIFISVFFDSSRVNFNASISSLTVEVKHISDERDKTGSLKFIGLG